MRGATGCSRPKRSFPRSEPTPYVVQEFVRLERPEVYRIYATSGTLFGWLARRYTDLGDPSFEAELMTRIRDSFWRRFEALRRQTLTNS